MLERLLFLVLTLNLHFISFGVVKMDTVFINSGLLVYTTDSFPSLAFNEDSLFTPENVVIQANEEDTVILSIINTDSVFHSIILDESNLTMGISPGQLITDSIYGMSEGLYMLKSSGNSVHLGLSTMVKVSNSNKAQFFWNLNEYNDSLNWEIRKGNSISFNDYTPNYFTVNGKSKNQLMGDSVVNVTGNVGDTLFINIINSGVSYHSVHFHGYHCDIVYSGLHNDYVGRSKDTFLTDPNERFVLRLVPDKPGEYPVHDHNLIAVTGGGIFPNGMFLMMNIQD